MKKTITIASFIAVISLVLVYFNYIPVYIGVTILICAFISALSASIVAAVITLQEVIKDEHNKSNECVQKSFEIISNKIEVLTKETEIIKSISESHIKQVDSRIKIVESKANEYSGKMYGSLSDIKLQLGTNSQRIEEKSDSLTKSLSNNSVEISKLIEVITKSNKDTQNAVNSYSAAAEKISSELSGTIKESNQSFAQNIADIVAKVSVLVNSFETYNNVSISLNDSNVKISSNITELVGKLGESTSCFLRENRRFVEGLEALSANNIIELKNAIRKSISEQTDSLSNYEEEIKTILKC